MLRFRALVRTLDGNKQAKGMCLAREARDGEEFISQYRGSSTYFN